MKSIDEIIEDAIAEEEIKQEQEKQEQEIKESNDFKDILREQLKEAFKPKDGETITISLDEYVMLNNKSKDLDRILNALVSDLGLSYSKESLSMKGDKVLDAFRVLYPEAYDTLLAYELENDEDK